MTQLYKRNGAVFIPAGVSIEEVERLKKENKDLKAQIEKMKRCSNCRNFNRDFELCFFSGGDEDYYCRNRRWELA